MSYQAALTDPEYRTPGKNFGLWDALRNRYLLMLLLKKGITTRYYGSALGWIWSYVRPAAQFVMYFVVISLIFGLNRGMTYFPIYLFSGIIVVNLFSESLRNTTSAITDNASLVKKIYLPRELFPLAAIGGGFVHFLPQLAVLFIVVLVVGWTVTWMQLVALLLALVIVLTFSLGLGLFFGAINVGYRDARNVVDLILMFATWASPVLYTWDRVYDVAPTWLFQLYMSNPVTAAVELFHNVFWLPIEPGNPPRPDHLMLNALIALVISLSVLAIGQLTFRKMEGNFAQHL